MSSTFSVGTIGMAGTSAGGMLLAIGHVSSCCSLSVVSDEGKLDLLLIVDDLIDSLEKVLNLLLRLASMKLGLGLI